MSVSLPVIVALIQSIDSVVSSAIFDNTTNTLSFTLLDGTIKAIQLDIEERYVGQNTVSNTMPNSTALTNFVESSTSPSRNPQVGDIVTWVNVLSNATDKIYRCTYYSTGWAWYEIPTIESASTTTLGLIKGDNETTTNSIRYTVTDGVVTSIDVKRGSTYVPITDFISTSEAEQLKGKSGTLTLSSGDFTNNQAQKTIADMGADDAIFFTPSTASDKTKIQDAEMFVSSSGNVVTFTVETVPSSTINLKFFVSRGTE